MRYFTLGKNQKKKKQKEQLKFYALPGMMLEFSTGVVVASAELLLLFVEGVLWLFALLFASINRLLLIALSLGRSRGVVGVVA
jgi:hypothetical protein